MGHLAQGAPPPLLRWWLLARDSSHESSTSRARGRGGTVGTATAAYCGLIGLERRRSDEGPHGAQGVSVHGHGLPARRKRATLRPPHRCRFHCQRFPRLRSFHSPRGLAMTSLPRRFTLWRTHRTQRVSCVPQPSAMMIPTLNKSQMIPGGATMPLDARSESNNLRGDPHAATEGGRTTRPKPARFFASNAAQKVGKKSS